MPQGVRAFSIVTSGAPSDRLAGSASLQLLVHKCLILLSNMYEYLITAGNLFS
jgi:hypothetical protein